MSFNQSQNQYAVRLRCRVRLSDVVLSLDVDKLHLQKLHTLSLPKDQTIRNIWLKFILNDMPDLLNKNVFICSSHLRTDSFLNYSQHAASCKHKL